MTDQFSFNEQQALTQPPPEVVEAEKAKLLAPKRPSKIKWLIGGGMLFALVLGVAVWLSRPRTAAPPDIVPGVPTIIPRNTALEEELTRLKGLLQQADPNGNPFPPPQVDMNVSF